MRRASTALALVLAAGYAFPALALETFSGKCVGVSDGDTVDVMRDGASVRVRLDGIDCPERAQDYGSRAKQFTSDLVFGKVVEVEVRDHDRYGRLVARVRVDGKDASVELVQAGLAWHYKKYSSDPGLAHAENEARAAKRGLWALPDPTPPWEYRHPSPRAGAAPGPAPTQASTATETAYHGNLRSHVFHSPSCRYYTCANCTQVFASREAAIAAGYRPCGICRP